MSQPTLCLVCGRVFSGVIAFLAHKCESPVTEARDDYELTPIMKPQRVQEEIAELERMYGEGPKC